MMPEIVRGRFNLGCPPSIAIGKDALLPLPRLAMKVMATSSSRFDDWCKAHAELALGFLSFLASSVLLCLCIPCGLSPVQLLGACLVEEEPLRKDAGHRPKADHPRHRHRVGSPTVRSP
ncbi:unnamed protein product [Effrenium voratum]|nr:unnamed protein product [Effrenium voratum]